MKKILAILSLTLLGLSLNAQIYNWSKEIEVNNSSYEVDYIGTYNNQNYFLVKTQISFMTSLRYYSTDENNNLVKKGKAIGLAKSSVIANYIHDGRIKLFLHVSDSKKSEVELVVIDPITLNELENETEVILELGGYNSVYFSLSPDSSFYSLNVLRFNPNTSKGYLDYNVFNANNNELEWENRLDINVEGSLTIKGFYLNNNGEAYLFAENEIPISRRKSKYRLLTIKTTESDNRLLDLRLELDDEVESIRSSRVDKDNIFLSLVSYNNLKYYNLNLYREEVESSGSYKILDDEGYFRSLKLQSHYRLDNDAMLIPIELRYKNDKGFFNQGITLFMVDIVTGELEAKKYISRAINLRSNHSNYASHSYMERPFFYTNQDGFNVIYNNQKKIDDLNRGFFWDKRMISRENKKIRTMKYTLSPNADVSLKELFSFETEGYVMNATPSFVDSQGRLVLCGGNRNAISFTVLD